MRFNSWFLLTFLIFIIFPKPLLSEEEPWDYQKYKEPSKSEQLKKLLDITRTSYKDALDFAKTSNIDKKSKWYKKIKYRLNKDEEFGKNSYNKKNVLFKVESKEKLHDINFVNTKPITTPTPIEINITKEEQEKYSKEMKKQINDFFTPPEIPPCKENKKEIIPNPLSDKIKLDEKKDGYIFFDSLLLSENVLKKINPKKILNKDFFGKRNLVEFYSTTPYDAGSLLLKNKGILCLPLRIIVTKQNIIKIYGEDALKNYDLKKEGEFHWKVKKFKDRFFDLKKG